MAELRPKPPPLSDAERRDLCAQVDFLALLSAQGVAVKKSGTAYRGSIRNEQDASCYFYPPNVGKQGGKGWTWHDFGTDKGGDSLGFLLDVAGMEWQPAVRYMAKMAGRVPDCVKTWDLLDKLDGKAAQDAPGTLPGGLAISQHPPKTPPRIEPPTLPPEDQALACRIYLDNLLAVHPEAQALGDAYLESRGTLAAGLPPCAYDLPADKAEAMLARICKGDAADLLLAAGLLKPAEDGKPLRLQWGAWAGDCCLLAHLDPRGRPVAFIARRLGFMPGDPVGKYLQQTYSRGAVRWPFGLPTLYRPPCVSWKPDRDKAGEVLVVEGTLDALGAAVLGWPALAFSMRPQARHWKDWTGACARMLEAHLPELCRRRVRVVPDNDPGEKGETGLALAARLVGWLRAAGCALAEVSTMEDLLPDLPPDCKDLGDAAKLKGCLP